MSINERIREVMFFSKKSGTELANELGITKSTITRTIKGDTLPSSKMLIPLGEKLGISIDWLLFGDGQMLRANNSSHVIDGNVRGEEIVVNNQGDKIDFLEKQIKLQNEQIKLLKQTIGDKEEIIKMLKAQ